MEEMDSCAKMHKFKDARMKSCTKVPDDSCIFAHGLPIIAQGRADSTNSLPRYCAVRVSLGCALFHICNAVIIIFIISWTNVYDISLQPRL
jgi:hypothetical protein